MATGYNINLPEESFRKAMAKFLMQEAAAKRQIKPSTPMGMHLQGLAGLSDRALLEWDLKKERDDRAANIRTAARNRPDIVPDTPAAPDAAPRPAPAAAAPRPPAAVPGALGYAATIDPDAVDPDYPQVEQSMIPGSKSTAPSPYLQRGPVPGPSAPRQMPPPLDDRAPGDWTDEAPRGVRTFSFGSQPPTSPSLPSMGNAGGSEPIMPRSGRTPGPQSRAGDDPVRAASYAPEGGGDALTPGQIDAIRTIAAEASPNDPEAMQAVAWIMRNRAVGSAPDPKNVTDEDLAGVVARKGQFEGRGGPNYRAAAPDTPLFGKARDATAGILRGEVPPEQDPTGGADHFYSPRGQSALRAQELARGGRARDEVPYWAAGQTPTGNFGGNSTFRLGNFPGRRQQTDAPVRPEGGGGPPQQPPVGGFAGPAAPPPPMQRPSLPGTGEPPTPPPMGPPQAGPAQMSPFRDRFQGDAPGPQSMLGGDGGGPMAALPFADQSGGRSPASMVGSIPGMPGADPNAVSMRPSMDVPMPDPNERDPIWPPPSPAGGAGAGPVLAQAQALQAPQGPPAPAPGAIPPGGRPSPATAGAGAVPGAPAAGPRAGVLAPPGGGGLMSPAPMVPPQAAPPPPAPQAAAAPPPQGAGGRPLIAPPEGSGIPQYIGTPEPRPQAGEVPGPVRRPMPTWAQNRYREYMAAAAAGNEEAAGLAEQVIAPYIQPHPYEVKEVEGKMYAVHPFTRKTTEIAGGKHREDIKHDYGTHTVIYDPYSKGLIGIIPKNVGEVKRQETVGTEQGKAQQALPETTANAARAGTILDEIEAHPGRDSSIGWRSRLPVIEGTTQFAFRKRLEEGMNQAQALALEALRGLGQATEKEREAIAAAKSRIHPGLSGPELTEAIREFKRVLQSGINGARQRAGLPPENIPSLVTPPRQSELPTLVPGQTRYNGKLYMGGDPNKPGSWRAE